MTAHSERLFSVEIAALGQCPHCDAAMPVNALVSQLACPACGRSLALEPECWRDLLVGLFKEAPYLPPATGRGARGRDDGIDVHVSWQRKDLADPSTGAAVDLERVRTAALEGKRHVPGESRMLVRTPPPEFLDALEAVAFLVGEDENQIAASAEQPRADLAPGGALIQFACPGCGSPVGVAGESRLLRCTYCGSEVVAPDDLWQSVHAKHRAMPWYLILDADRCPVHWAYPSLEEALADTDGRLYLILNPREDVDEGWLTGRDDRPDMRLVCVDPDRRAVWFREDLHLSPRPEDLPRLCLLSRGRLGVWTRGGEALEILSARDGSTVAVWPASVDAASRSGPEPERIDIGRVRSIAQAWDGTYLVWYREDPPPGVDAPGGAFGLRRFDEALRALPTWQSAPGEPDAVSSGPGEKAPKRAWFSGWLGRRWQRNAPLREGEAPAREEVPQSTTVALQPGNRPGLVEDAGVVPLAGPEGHVFLLSRDAVARYLPNGTQVYFTRLDPDALEVHKAVVTPEGSLRVPGEYEDESGDARTGILEIDASGRVGLAVPESMDGVSLKCAEQVALCSDGVTHVLGIQGEWWVLDRDGLVLAQRQTPFPE